jgi:flavodoxin
MRTVVAYYSRTGNTRFVAEEIAEQLNADLCEVVDKKSRKGKLIFLTGGFAALRKKLTEIEVTKPVDDYELVVVGSPVWAGRITPAIRTFLSQNDFSDKKMAVFVTLGGDKPEKSLESMKEAIVPKVPVGELAIINNLENKAEAKQQITEWCKKIR